MCRSAPAPRPTRRRTAPVCFCVCLTWRVYVVDRSVSASTPHALFPPQFITRPAVLVLTLNGFTGVPFPASSSSGSPNSSRRGGLRCCRSTEKSGGGKGVARVVLVVAAETRELSPVSRNASTPSRTASSSSSSSRGRVVAVVGEAGGIKRVVVGGRLWVVWCGGGRRAAGWARPCL